MFHTVVGVIMLAFAVIGFGQFYFEGMAYPGRPIPPPARNLVFVHASVMTAWLILMIVQPFLIFRGSRKVHMKLGWLGAVLAVAIVISGLMIAIMSARFAPPETRIWGVTPKQFMVVPFVGVLVFATFIALGIKNRRNPQVHRAMMLLGTLATLSAAVGRIDPLNALYLGTAWETHFGPFFLTLVFNVILVIAHSVMTRSIDRVFAYGTVISVALMAAIWKLGSTDLWASIANAIV